MDSSRKLFIYTLRLESKKYYVGKTTDLMRRLNEHQNGEGSAWTKKYKALFVEDILVTVDPFDEDKCTKNAMAKFGIENVRGGSYVTVVLPPEVIGLLERELRNASNCCVRCGADSHYINKCPLNAPKDKSKKKIADTKTEPSKTVVTVNNKVADSNKTVVTVNKGAKWKPEEVSLLISRFEDGTSIIEISQLHGRTVGAIEAKLASLGKIEAKQWYTKN
ncbi:Hypothetical protein POVR1_LOCUS450 [uncultured virus]|nr:Hypothetical protein POVR1_LOCUS450 [uncultured virus]